MMSLLIFISLFLFCKDVLAVELIVTNNGPVVLGSNVTFTATVIGYDSEELKYTFFDNVQPEHEEHFIVKANMSQWVVEYPRHLYETGEYVLKVRVQKNWLDTGLWLPYAFNSTVFNLTDTLNGELNLVQNGTVRPNNYVAVNYPITHTVTLPPHELEYLRNNASTILAYWFIDCQYLDQTTDFELNYTYPESMEKHFIDVLIIADTNPLPPIPTTTTTTTSTTTTTTSTTTTTTPKPKTIETTAILNQNTTTSESNSSTIARKVKRDTSAVKKHKVHPLKDFICNNSGIVPIGANYIYGHYRQTINVREPITKVNITGNIWLQHSDLMSLQVTFPGSPPFQWCAMYRPAPYNITGNETCTTTHTTEANQFPLIHYFSESNPQAVVVVVENEVGQKVAYSTITFYTTPIHTQLSVIVVPVTFCLLAVILIVFGVAYYQHRSRHTVEVADFDFGQAHLDYKTFKERLRDSFRNAFNLRHEDDDTDPLAAPSSRYDTIT